MYIHLSYIGSVYLCVYAHVYTCVSSVYVISAGGFFVCAYKTSTWGCLNWEGGMICIQRAMLTPFPWWIFVVLGWQNLTEEVAVCLGEATNFSADSKVGSQFSAKWNFDCVRCYFSAQGKGYNKWRKWSKRAWFLKKWHLLTQWNGEPVLLSKV